MNTLEAPPIPKHQRIDGIENVPQKPFTFEELSQVIQDKETKLVEGTGTPAQNEEKLLDLYDLLRDVKERYDTNPNIPARTKFLHTSLILTEIAHARVALSLDSSKHLSDTKEQARWHQSTSDFIREVLRTKKPSDARELISAYWDEQEIVFTHPFRQFPQHVLKEHFEKHKSGVLAAVAFETALNEIPHIQMKEHDAKTDAAYAVDYIITAPDKYTFLVQLTSTKNADKSAVDLRVMRGIQSATNEKERKFVMGYSRYAKERHMDVDEFRAVYITMGPGAFDGVTGEPSAEVVNMVTEMFSR